MSIAKGGTLELTKAQYDEAVQLELARVAKEEARQPKQLPTPTSSQPPVNEENDSAAAAGAQ